MVGIKRNGRDLPHVLRVRITNENGEIEKEWNDEFPSLDAAMLVLESRVQLVSDSVVDHHTKERCGRFLEHLRKHMEAIRECGVSFAYFEMSEPSYSEHYQLMVARRAFDMMSKQELRQWEDMHIQVHAAQLLRKVMR